MGHQVIIKADTALPQGIGITLLAQLAGLEVFGACQQGDTFIPQVDEVLGGGEKAVKIVFNHFGDGQFWADPGKGYQWKPFLIKHLDLIEIARVSRVANEEAVDPAEHQRLDVFLLYLGRFVRLCDNGAVTHAPNRVLDAADDGCEKGLLDIGDNDAEHAGLILDQSQGEHIGLIIQFLGYLKYCLTGVGIYIGVVRERP